MIQLIQYSNRTHNFKEKLTPLEAHKQVNDNLINWIDIETGDRAIVEEIAKLFDLHPLIVDDILDVDQIPKFEGFEQYVFLSAKMLRYNHHTHAIQQEQISIVLSKNLIITFQEGMPGDVFDKLRDGLPLPVA